MVYDITRELFSTEVYHGDPVPGKKFVMFYAKEEPDVCQVTELTLGSHSGTHLDAPRHFCRDGKTVAEIDISKCMGPCTVVCPDSAKECREGGNDSPGEKGYRRRLPEKRWSR